MKKRSDHFEENLKQGKNAEKQFRRVLEAAGYKLAHMGCENSVIANIPELPKTKIHYVGQKGSLKKWDSEASLQAAETMRHMPDFFVFKNSSGSRHDGGFARFVEVKSTRSDDETVGVDYESAKVLQQFSAALVMQNVRDGSFSWIPADEVMKRFDTADHRRHGVIAHIGTDEGASLELLFKDLVPKPVVSRPKTRER